MRVGVPTWIGYGAIYIAKEAGLLGGLQLEIRRSDDSNVFNAAMLRGELDAYCTTLDTHVIAAAAGVPGHAVYLFDESAGADGIVAKPLYSTVQDLRGRTIAAQTGFPNHFFLLHVMKTAGLRAADYRHLNLDSDKAGAAFVSGSLDAAVTWEPWLTQARETGRGKLIASTREHPGLIVDALIASPNSLTRRGSVWPVLVEGLQKAVELWRSDPQRGNEIVGRNFSLKPDVVERMVAGVRFLDRPTNRRYLAPQGQATTTLANAIAIWQEAKLIRKKPDVSALVTDVLVR